MTELQRYRRMQHLALDLVFARARFNRLPAKHPWREVLSREIEAMEEQHRLAVKSFYDVQFQ